MLENVDPTAGPGNPTIGPVAQPDPIDTALESLSRRQGIAYWEPILRAERDAWEAGLPPEAPELWRKGGAYVRLSRGTSMAGEAPDVYLRQTLALMAQKQVYVAADAVYFEVESATDIGPRGIFRRLFERAMAGGLSVIGAAVNERLFRNVEQSKQIKRQFRVKGIELFYLGMWEGDRRHPAGWQLETFQEVTAELHARTTSYNVGTHLEDASRRGRPMGVLPEVFEEGNRGPSILGRRGSVQTWRQREPLASIVKEGCRKFLDGESLSAVATWSMTTELKGVTPVKHRIMNKGWWYQMLRNPKLAGYQRPTEYMGYKPGIESPKRPPRSYDSELVPCLLPPLWDLETYHAIVATAKARYVGPRNRRSYRHYLTSGILFDVECGHRLAVKGKQPDGRFWVSCQRTKADGVRHQKGWRADVVEREVDELFARISIDDAGLNELIEEELRELAHQESRERERFKPNPAIGSLRQAILALQAAKITAGRTELERELAALEAADEVRREALSEPLVSFQTARAQLANWSEVWSSGNPWSKNELLREAGVRVEIGQLPGETAKHAPAHVLSITAENPVFALALAGALSARTGDKTTNRRAGDQIPAIKIAVSAPDAGRMRRVGAPVEQNLVLVDRPVFPISHRKARPVSAPKPAGEWLTLTEVAARLGRSTGTAHWWVRQGHLRATEVFGGRRRWYLVRPEELDRFIQRGIPEKWPKASRELTAWVRREIVLRGIAQKDLAQASGVGKAAIHSLQVGASSSGETVVALARALLDRFPDPDIERLLASEPNAGRWGRGSMPSGLKEAA